MSIPTDRSEVRGAQNPRHRAAPVLGQDNYEVYTQILGLSDAAFIDLMGQGVFE
jgi:hypothetical protein